MMTHHQHIQMLVDGVDRVGRMGLVDDGKIFAPAAFNIRGVSAARALGVVGMDGPSCNRLQGFLDEPRLV